jgi:hypothetical protein
MSAAASHAPEQARGLEPRLRHPDVLRCVRQQERLEALVPKVVTAAIFGGTTAYLLLRAGGLTGGVLIGAALAFFAAAIVNAIVRVVLLQPSRRIRYGAAAKRLAARLESAADLSVPALSWFAGSPGALGVQRNGDLVVAARGTGYEQLRLSPRQIADVRVERDVAHVTSTRHSGRIVVGGFGGGLIGAHVLGGRSTSVTRAVEDVCIELAYQFEPNGAVGTIVVAFGADRCQAEATAALIRRLQGQS